MKKLDVCTDESAKMERHYHKTIKSHHEVMMKLKDFCTANMTAQRESFLSRIQRLQSNCLSNITSTMIKCNGKNNLPINPHLSNVHQSLHVFSLELKNIQQRLQQCQVNLERATNMKDNSLTNCNRRIDMRTSELGAICNTVRQELGQCKDKTFYQDRTIQNLSRNKSKLEIDLHRCKMNDEGEVAEIQLNNLRSTLSSCTKEQNKLIKNVKALNNTNLMYKNFTILWSKRYEDCDRDRARLNVELVMAKNTSLGIKTIFPIAKAKKPERSFKKAFVLAKNEHKMCLQNKTQLLDRISDCQKEVIMHNENTLNLTTSMNQMTELRNNISHRVARCEREYEMFKNNSITKLSNYELYKVEIQQLRENRDLMMKMWNETKAELKTAQSKLDDLSAEIISLTKERDYTRASLQHIIDQEEAQEAKYLELETRCEGFNIEIKNITHHYNNNKNALNNCLFENSGLKHEAIRHDETTTDITQLLNKLSSTTKDMTKYQTLHNDCLLEKQKLMASSKKDPIKSVFLYESCKRKLRQFHSHAYQVLDNCRPCFQKFSNHLSSKIKNESKET